MLGSKYIYEEIGVLRKSITDLNYNLKRRINRIESRYGDVLVSVQKYRELEKRMPQRLSKVNDMNELRKLYRDLHYINSLSTSRVKGAETYIESTKELLDKFKDKYESWTKSDRSLAYSVMSRLEEYFGGLYQRFKYQVLESITDIVDQQHGLSVDEITEKFIQAYTDVDYEMYLNRKKGKKKDDSFNVLYSKKLRDLFR